MHIGLLIYGDLSTISGGFIYDRIIHDHLIKQKNDITIVSLPWHGEMRTLLHNLSASLLNRLQRADFDVLIQDELNHPSCFMLNRRVRTRIDYPVVALVHHPRSCEEHPWMTRPYYAHVERLYLRSVDGFIYNSATTRTAVESMVGTKPAVVAQPGKDRLHTVLSPGAITARVQHAGALRILFVGNIIRRKGLHTLLRALTAVDDPWTLTIIGNTRIDQAYTTRVQRYVRARQLSTKVRFAGTVTDRELTGHLRNHDILTVPSTYEGLGIVYIEAQAFGMPSIGTTAGGAGEVIEHGTTGFIVPPNSPSILARYLHLLASDRRLLEKMSIAARSAYQQHPTWSETTGKIQQFLRTLTA